MKRNFAGKALLVCLTILLTLLCAAGALADEPIAVEMEVSQTQLTGVGTVRVSINVFNITDDGSTISVTLYDPDKNVCASFGSGGTANLAPGTGASFSGSWTVTQAQLDAGKITYTASYKVTDENGNVNAVSRPIAKSITYQTATPKLNVERTAPTKAVEGQTTTVSYLLTNIGTVDVTDIQILDPGLSAEPLTCPLLGVGQSVQLNCDFVMGSEPMVTQPTVTYNYLVGSEEKQNKIDGPAKTIDVATVDVLVQLAAKSLIVNKGDKVELNCTITNKGDVEYTKLSVADATLGDIESGITLGAKKEHTVKKSITVSASGTYKFIVSALDASGNTVTFASNELTIQTAEDIKETLGDDAIAPDLEIVVEADREIIYTEPSEIAFLIKVTNFGRLAAEKVTITEDGTTVKTIDVIQPNETVTFAKMFTTNVAGQIQFVASTKDSAGETHSFESNIVKVTYVAPAPTPTPTPVPTIAPTATPVPTETPSISPFVDEEDQGGTTGRVLLYVLAGLLLVILVAVVLLVLADRRRNAPKGPRGGREAVIDSMERSSRRNYAQPAPRRAGARRGQAAPVQEETEEYDEPQEAPARTQFPQEDAEPEAPADRFARPMPRRELQIFNDDGDEQPTRSAMRRESGVTASGSDYLSRMRGERRQPDDEAEGTRMTDDEAALVSGGDAQYRISRSMNDVRHGGTWQAEDPQAFARGQRMARSGYQQTEEPLNGDDEGSNDDE